MTEWEKGQQGYLYDANNDKEIIKRRRKCASLCHKYNMTNPRDVDKLEELAYQIIGHIEGKFEITSPFYCDYGTNISIGDHFYANHNLTILDGTLVTIGNYVFIGPNCVISTAGHPVDAELRNKGLEIALPISIGNNVWIGANVSILPGVKIGNNVVIGAGSVVTKDIPNCVVAVGNPCRVLRNITEEDKKTYPMI